MQTIFFLYFILISERPNFWNLQILGPTKDNYYISDTRIPVFIGDKKETGTDCLVPIHPKIQPIVEKQLKLNGKTNSVMKEERM